MYEWTKHIALLSDKQLDNLYYAIIQEKQKLIDNLRQNTRFE